MSPKDPQRILVATDLSACSRPALDYAMLLARRFGAGIHLVHVAQPPTFVAPEAIEVASQAIAAEVVDGQKRIDNELTRLEGGEIAGATGEVVVGLASDVITAHANSGRYDLVVMGTHGRGGLMHLVLGSVAEQVVRRSAIPVVTVRPDRAAA